MNFLVWAQLYVSIHSRLCAEAVRTCVDHFRVSAIAVTTGSVTIREAFDGPTLRDGKSINLPMGRSRAGIDYSAERTSDGPGAADAVQNIQAGFADRWMHQESPLHFQMIAQEAF